jgi:hypothetical protein
MLDRRNSNSDEGGGGEGQCEALPPLPAAAAVVSVRSLVGACRRLSLWHHGEAVRWAVEVAPEVKQPPASPLAQACFLLGSGVCVCVRFFEN